MFAVQGKTPAMCAPTELAAFLKLAQESGEVRHAGLEGRIRAAEKLVFCHFADKLVGIAAIKRPLDDYRTTVSKGSGFGVAEEAWPFELGWVFVLLPYRRKGASTLMVERALRGIAVPIFATSRVNNTGMHAILKSYEFLRSGKDYNSKAGDYQIRLFTRPSHTI